MAGLRVRQLRRGEWSDDFIARWRELEDRSLAPSVYTSASFILPALQHLSPRAEPVIIAVEEIDGGQLVALGLFERCFASPRIPFPHFTAYKSVHTYQTGLLVAPERSYQSLRLLLGEVRREVAALEMLYRCADGSKWSELLAAASEIGWTWTEYRRFERAVLRPNDSRHSIDQTLSAKRRKAVRKALRGLDRRGEMNYRVVRDLADLESSLETFLKLEDMGWKRAAGVSLRSSPRQLAFFRTMARRFMEEDRLRVAELRLGDRVIASTVHLISGKTSYAFKLGWDTEFARQKVGILQQVLTAEHAADDFPNLETLDSCTEEGSFFEKLWPERRTIISGVFAATGLPHAVVSSIDRVRKLKRSLPSLFPSVRIAGDPCGH